MGMTKTILLVDDDTDILGAMRLVLEKKGYRVVTATDGNTGLAAAERCAPGLVVVDMMMPRRSGLLVLQKIKSREYAGPPVIIITANEVNRHQAYAVSLGVDDFLHKPFA